MSNVIDLGQLGPGDFDGEGHVGGEIIEPACRTLGAEADESDNYELYDAWNGAQRIQHTTSGREGTWTHITDNTAFSKDGPVATIKWANGSEETLTTQGLKQYFSSKSERAFSTTGFRGPLRHQAQ